MIRIAAFLVAFGLPCASCFAQANKPNVRDSAAIQDCVKTKTGSNWNWEKCIGMISEPCVKDETSMPPSEIMACYVREEAVWDDILNESFRRLRARLDETKMGKLREMQRAWIASRDKTCAFFYDYFEGSMANPMMAACTARETGRRALFLLGFANDQESK
ncbi:MAG TPA: lysozyme inhibitor LprI family protein [Pseudolabrys sp.]